MLYATLIRYGLEALAIAALATALYAFGYSHGSTSGYKSGWNAQQVTINKMVTAANAQRKAQNQAISDVQVQAMTAQAQIFTAEAHATLARNTIVTQYKTKYVTVAQSCGWSTPTVQTINQLLNLGGTGAQPQPVQPPTQQLAVAGGTK
jgi:hypothetical protein